MLLGKNTKYGNEMAVSELQKIVSEIEKESGFSIYDIFYNVLEGIHNESTGVVNYWRRRRVNRII